MFHNRIASDLRKHFSTVGPSPSLAASQMSAISDPPASGSSVARLILLPSTGPDFRTPQSASLLRFQTAAPDVPSFTRDRRNLLKEFVKVSSHRVAAFLAEAAVLVLVLGILDRFLTSNRFDLHWVGGAFLISTLLLGLSIALELSARLWLART